MSNTQIVDIKVGDLIVTTDEYHRLYAAWKWRDHVDFTVGEIVGKHYEGFAVHPVDVVGVLMSFSDSWFVIEKPYFIKLYVKQS